MLLISREIVLHILYNVYTDWSINMSEKTRIIYETKNPNYIGSAQTTNTITTSSKKHTKNNRIIIITAIVTVALSGLGISAAIAFM